MKGLIGMAALAFALALPVAAHEDHGQIQPDGQPLDNMCYHDDDRHCDSDDEWVHGYWLFRRHVRDRRETVRDYFRFREYHEGRRAQLQRARPACDRETPGTTIINACIESTDHTRCPHWDPSENRCLAPGYAPPCEHHLMNGGRLRLTSNLECPGVSQAQGP